MKTFKTYILFFGMIIAWQLYAALPKEQGFVEPGLFVIGQNPNFKLDGKFDFGEYSVSSNLIYCLKASMRTSGDDGRWAFSTCGDMFIAAVRTPVTGPLKATYGDRDGAIWEDDCHELLLMNPENTRGYHFIANVRNGFYDSRLDNGQEVASWNCKGIMVRQFEEAGFWTTEIQMPISEVADVIKLPEFYADFYRTNCTTDGYCAGQYRGATYLDTQLFLKMRLEADAPSVNVITDTVELCRGNLNVNVTAKGEGKITYYAGVEPLDFATNDAFNFAKEEKIAEGELSEDVHSAVIKKDKLPASGTLHYTVKQNDKVIYDRYIAYSLSDFQKFNIISINADDTRKNVNAILALPASLGKIKIISGLRNEENEIVAVAETENGGTCQVSVPLEDVLPGKYVFFAKTESGAEDTVEFAVLPEKPEWMGNTLGYTNGKAPAPWTDIVIEGKVAHVWNREILFNGIPVSMKSKQGWAARNIRFMAGNMEMTAEDFKWTEIKGDIAKFESLMAFQNGEMKVKGTLEFDGLVWLNCTFQPRIGMKLPDIELQMDVTNGNGRFVYTSEHNNSNCHLLKKDQKWQKNLLSSKSTFWVGSPEVGIDFVADDLRGWNLSDYSSSAQLTADENGTRVITVPILEEKLNKIDAEYQIEFALQATPTRPMPKNYSAYQINGGYPNQNIRCFEPAVTTLFNAPSKLRSDYKDRLQNVWHEKYQVKNVLPYLAFTAASPFTDEYRFYSEQWRSCSDPRPRAKPIEYMYYQQICPKGEGYADWYMWELDKMNKEIPQDGLYFDFGQPTVYPCRNRLHGCAWIDNHGREQTSMRIKASRELLKRIFVFMKEKNPEAIIGVHDSGGFVPAFDCFCDFTWNGEQIALLMYYNNVSYRGLYDPGQFTLEQNGRIWGVPAFNIPQFVRALGIWDPQRYGKVDGDPYWVLKKGWLELPDTPESVMQYMGLLYAVGGDCSMDYGVFEHLDEMRQVELSIGWTDDTKFYGWYDDRNPFKLTNPKTHQTIVSSYEAEKGWMVVALNDTKTDEIFRIAVPENLRNQTFREHITQQEMLVNADGMLEMKMPAYCARFIILQMEQ